MAETLIITVKRKFAGRRKWREWWAIFRWGTGGFTLYEERDLPVDLGGHNGYLGKGVLAKRGRRDSYELELTFFEPMKEGSSWEHAQMREEMREALVDVAKNYGYSKIGWREAKPTTFA